MKTISRLYDNHIDALAAVQALRAAGVENSEISIVSNNSENWYDGEKPDRDGDGVDDRAEAAGTGAGVGAALGGAAGLLAGLGLLAIPGLGPVVAAGWLASTAVGAVAGGATGGLVGALTEAGVGEDDAHAYAEGVRRGGSLVTAKIADGDEARLASILNSSGVDLDARREAFRTSGWKQFDDSAPTLSTSEVRAERERYTRM